MAYYTTNSNPYQTGEFNLSFGYGYDVVPDDQDSLNHSSSACEFNHQTSTDYHSGNYYEAYDNFVTQSYITHHFNQYEPTSYQSYYYTPQTNIIVSYSKSNLDDTDFIEYDPTPYGGGYDIIQTYGKPLPPSDQICYPRTKTATIIPIPSSMEDDAAKPEVKQSKPEEQSIIKEKQRKQSDANKEGVEKGNGQTEKAEKPLERNGGDELIESERIEVVDYYPSYGSGLETMDICESLFGYWPCLSKKYKNNNWCGEGRRCRDEGNYNMNPWQGAADYIFGTPDGQLNDGQRNYYDFDCGYSGFGHEDCNYKQKQYFYYGQEEYDGNS